MLTLLPSNACLDLVSTLSMEIEMFGFRGDMLRLSISQAVADGHAVRSAREEARRLEEEAEARKLQAQREARVQAVMIALPNGITRAVANAAAMPVQCIVMFVPPCDYAGNVYHDFYTCETKPQADAFNLRGAAAMVFEELQLAGCAPTLKYEYQFGAESSDSQPSSMDQLCICITVQ